MAPQAHGLTAQQIAGNNVGAYTAVLAILDHQVFRMLGETKSVDLLVEVVCTGDGTVRNDALYERMKADYPADNNGINIAKIQQEMAKKCMAGMLG